MLSDRYLYYPDNLVNSTRMKTRLWESKPPNLHNVVGQLNSQYIIKLQYNPVNTVLMSYSDQHLLAKPQLQTKEEEHFKLLNTQLL